MSKITNEQVKKRYEQDLVKSVIEDFEKRREERKNLEYTWKINLNYLAGNQYCEISPSGELIEEEKYYGWQNRSVFNHIAPIIDTRLAKLSKVRPVMSVRASGAEESDIKTAEISSEILNSSYSRLKLDEEIKKATVWSEACGTAFYKITWNTEKGRKLGESDGVPIYEGDIEISVVPPFEIFPDSLTATDFNSVKSLIHAKAVHVDDIEEKYGVTLKGQDIDVFSLNETGVGYNGGYRKKEISSTLKNHVLVIEKYQKPNKTYKNGRLIIVASNTLLYEGELPYINGIDGKRTFPFVKQTCLNQAGAFFGISVIERLIPVQRAYNAVKNRKYEFMNRISYGIVNVEDGSIDTDELADEGLSPGKVIVYRQGSRPPQMLNTGNVPMDFNYEEERLLNEFISISGTSEVSRSSQVNSSLMSGVALELLIEQDETRLSVTSESVNNAIKEIGKMILRLFKEFAGDSRIMQTANGQKAVKLFYFKSTDITCDDIELDTENGLTRTPAQRKSAVLEMLQTGLLSDENGTVSSRTKAKLLEILGYGTLENTQDIVNLHKQKAEKENVEMLTKSVAVDEFDDHAVHIEEHLRYILEETGKKSPNRTVIQRITEHYSTHVKLKNEQILSVQNLMSKEE